MRLLAITVLGFVVLIFAARVVGGTQPPSEVLGQLHLTDCALPCWAGIMPGQTTLEQAVPLVKTTFPDAMVADSSSRIVISVPPNSILVEADSGIVSHILFSICRACNILLGDVMAFYGSPSCGAAFRTGNPTYGFAHANAVITLWDSGGLRLKEHVTGIALNSLATEFRCPDAGK